MATLPKPPETSGVKIEETAPKGTHLAVCIKVHDQWGVQRRKYQSDEMEEQNVTRFYFGLKDKNGKPYVVRSREMKILGGDRANLVKFLNGWNGEPFPYGVDYTGWAEGRGAMIVVSHWQGTDKNAGKTFAGVDSAAPVMDGLEDKVPAKANFAAFLEDDDTTASTTQAAAPAVGTDGENDPPF